MPAVTPIAAHDVIITLVVMCHNHGICLDTVVGVPSCTLNYLFKSLTLPKSRRQNFHMLIFKKC